MGKRVRVWRPRDGWALPKKAKVGHYVSATIEELRPGRADVLCNYGSKGPREAVPADCVSSLPPVRYGQEHAQFQV